MKIELKLTSEYYFDGYYDPTIDTLCDESIAFKERIKSIIKNYIINEIENLQIDLSPNEWSSTIIEIPYESNKEFHLKIYDVIDEYYNYIDKIENTTSCLNAVKDILENDKFGSFLKLKNIKSIIDRNFTDCEI